MAHRHPALPTLWLMTDERQGEGLWQALETLPRGSGVVFRHHRTEASARGALFARITLVARRRQLLLVEEQRSPRLGVARAPYPSSRSTPGQGRATGWIARVHNLREARTARRAGAMALFLSPIFATRTHPGQPALGALRAGEIARASRIPCIALGGMTQRRFRRLQGMGFYGWAAIDGLT